MGVCGYTWDEVQTMPMQALARAISARNRFANAILRAFLGGEEPPKKAAPGRQFSIGVFDALFGGGA